MAEDFYDRDFPNLINTGGSKRTSEPADYNCIAFAVWDETQWWWPRNREDEHWPLPIPDKITIQTFIEAFLTRGFTLCTPNREPEAGYHKIALFALEDGTVKHAARLEDGMTRWKSKLGPEEDIEHVLEGLEGPCYGKVVEIFRKSVDSPFAPPPHSSLAPSSSSLTPKADSRGV
jgi:hypothetical protein